MGQALLQALTSFVFRARLKNPKTVRLRHREARVNWALPLETGDTTQDRPLTRYRTEFIPSPGSKAVTISLIQSVLMYDVQSTVGGTFSFCAAHGGMYACGLADMYI